MPSDFKITNHNKTEILTMIILISSEIIEYHTPEHLFNIFRILSQKAGQGKEVVIIKHRMA